MSDVNDICVLCHAHGPDKRTLIMACVYHITEMVPEAELHEDKLYYARICKTCRGEFLDGLRVWRDQCVRRRALDKDHDGEPLDSTNPEADIPVRVSGRIVMMTGDEYVDYCNAKEQT